MVLWHERDRLIGWLALETVERAPRKLPKPVRQRTAALPGGPVKHQRGANGETPARRSLLTLRRHLRHFLDEIVNQAANAVWQILAGRPKRKGLNF